MNYRALLCGALTVAATSLTAVPSSAMPISPASILTAAEDSDLIVQVRGELLSRGLRIHAGGDIAETRFQMTDRKLEPPYPAKRDCYED